MFIKWHLAVLALFSPNFPVSLLAFLATSNSPGRPDQKLGLGPEKCTRERLCFYFEGIVPYPNHR